MLAAMDEPASGYERIAGIFRRARDRTIGADVVRAWSTRLPRQARVLDVGCGDGVPITAVLVHEGFDVHAVDASPTLVAAFGQQFPDVPVECSDVETCLSLDDAFDGVIAWGLVFLLPPAAQHRVLARLAAALVPGGHLLFTAPRHACTWEDALTGRLSWSLGAAAYADILARHGVVPDGTAEDSGGNVYHFGRRRGS
jgi:2-polyprenyl-3-methyl-5-hydroxy-6-metoxy-1,4-benzoquinol methylase